MTPAPALATKSEADACFRTGDYAGAAERYLAAIALHDSDPIYFSNLAAAYLKLNKFSEAVDAAHAALLKDPRAFKPRYRRAMGRKGLGLHPECLIDLASVLTLEPGNADANREFDAVEAICQQERRLFNSEQIAAADFPPMFGPSGMTDEAVGAATTSAVPPPRRTGGTHIEICFLCRAKKLRKKIKTCTKCMAVKYCSVDCQRADWPEHKKSCKPASDNHITVRLGRTMSQHQYFPSHLLLYAIRALGLTTRMNNYTRFILLIVVEMVPIVSPGPPGTPSQRLAISRLLSVPIHVIPDKVRDEYVELVNQALANHLGNPLYGYWITANGIYTEGGDWRYRLWVSRLEGQLLHALRNDASMSFPVQSLSLGREQHLRLDLESLFQNMEDELRLDVANKYDLRAASYHREAFKATIQ
ncbi:hypothetical protein DFH06DRAFT_1255942 [Mycena polygramma]|nr:hypothetical protein DFH06DRAFT_1255942 [Mycena polygramma]